MTVLKRIYGPLLERNTYLETAYLLLGLLFGTLWFVLFVTLYAVGIGTVIVWVGVGILVGTQALLRPVGVIERFQVRWLLRHEVPSPARLYVEHIPGSRLGWKNIARWSRALARDIPSWKTLAWIGLRVVAGPLGFTFAVIFLTVPLALVATPTLSVLDWGGLDVRPEWAVWASYWPIVLLVVAPVLAWAVRSLADAHRWLADWCLGSTGDDARRLALARAAMAEEQIRIDQELHDSIGHMVSMIVVQAGAGAHVFDRDPAFARRALGNIEERGRAALGELDRIIARIRGDQPETHAPLPGVDDLPALLDGAREAGVSVSSRLEVGDVPAALGRGIYRVVQEALTNAAKHAPGGKVVVAAVSRDNLVAVSVVNTLVATPPSDLTGGNGLAGIRDRVTLLGGHATVGPTPDSTFAVKAVLPVDDLLPEEGMVDCRLTGRCRCLVCRTVKGSGTEKGGGAAKGGAVKGSAVKGGGAAKGGASKGRGRTSGRRP